MNRVFRTCVMLAVTAHMVLGCCLHHAHGHDNLTDPLSVLVRTDCPCNHERERSIPESEHPSHPTPCDGDKCVFTRLDSIDSPDLLTKNVAVALVCAVVSFPSHNHCETVNSRSCRPTFPIPLHLLNQVLLI
jgi:hypothetical protein